MRVLIATANKGKIAELERLLSGQRLELSGLGNLETDEVIETGATYAENALLKARYYHAMTRMPTIADDSGLEFEALGGRPGVYSARYGGPGATDADRIAKLLNELKGVPPENRTARFVCAAAIAWDGGERVFVAEAPGSILEQPRGSGGFGYDPIFYYPQMGRTFAELDPDEKAAVSHRGLAFRRLTSWLKRPGVLDTVKAGDKISSSTG